MKQVYNQKHSIAWFKIADYVSRGEKERALGMYKLLAHSIEDHALRAQIEGDILWAFNDQESIQRYKKAAELYQLQAKLLQAAALYEHILHVSDIPSTIDIREQLVEIYAKLSMSDVMVRHIQILTDTYRSIHDREQADKMCEQWKDKIKVISIKY